MHRNTLIGVFCASCLSGVRSFAQEPDQGSLEARVREMIERSCVPGDQWIDPGMLLWLVDHPPRGAGENLEASGMLSGLGLRERALRLPDHVDSLSRPGAMSSPVDLLARSPIPAVAVRLSRQWNDVPGQRSMNTSSTFTLRPTPGFFGEGRWVEVRETDGVRRSFAGGIEVHDLGILSGAVAGDFRFLAGAGLVFGGGMPARRTTGSLRDHLGVSIPAFAHGYRGVILRAQYPSESGTAELIMCYSRVAVDRIRSPGSTVDADPEAGDGVRVLPGGTERVYGLRGRVALGGRWALGLSWALCSVVDGQRTHIVGCDLSFGSAPCAICVEIGRQSPGYMAGSAHVELRVGAHRIVAGGRVFSPGYWNLHGADLEADGDARSERSAWAECTLRMAPWLVVNTAMSGIWRVTYAGICPVIVGSTRSALRLDAFPMTGMRMGASLSVSERDQVSTGADRHGRRIQVVRAWTTTTGRMEMDLSIHRRVEWSIRCAGTGVVSPETGRKETGLLMGIGCQWTPSSYLQLEARWTAFGTDSYDTRMYQGEQLVPGTARYVLIYGEGDRSGVWLRITPWHGAGITTAVTRTSRLTERGAAVVRSACAVQLDVRM